MLTGFNKKLTFKSVELTSNYQLSFENTTHTNSHQQPTPRSSNTLPSVWHGKHCRQVSRFRTPVPPLLCVVLALRECATWLEICNLHYCRASCTYFVFWILTYANQSDLSITLTEFHTATFIISFIIHPYCCIYNTGFFKLYTTKYIQLYKTVLVSIYELWHGTIHVTDSITCLGAHSQFLQSFYVGIDHLHSFFPIRGFYSSLLLQIVTPCNYCMGRKQKPQRTETKTRAVTYTHKHLHYLARIENIQQLQTYF